MKFKNKNVLVYGLSVSGEWASKLLLKLKANVFLYDDNKEKLKTKPIQSCYLINELNENIITQFDYIVLSPSIEKDNPFVQIAKQNNIKIFSELEFASLFCKKLVAVTGTNGKTTTVQLITALLNKKHKAVACGNIGEPLSKTVLRNKRYIKVAEVSSFMLENASLFHPHVATILNIEPDHLVRHKTMDEYTKLKYNIFANLQANDYAVVNLDNNIRPQNDCLTVTYSCEKIADIFLKNNAIYIHQHKIVNLNELKIKGKHNIYNIMCALAYAYLYNVKISDMQDVLRNFSLDKFRMQYIKTINEINFINDSKSTNIAATLACAESVKGAIILLLGGSKKGLDFSKLFSKLTKRVKLICAYGEIKDDLFNANNNKFKLIKCNNLTEAFNIAVKNALPNDSVVLSPATASYDQFANYIERGQAFNKKVAEYESEVAKG